MKLNFTYSLTLVMVLLLSACSKEERLPLDDTSLGMIGRNRNILGINQKIVLNCEVAVSQNATNVKIQWETADGIAIEQDNYENGISYCTFTWDAPGDYAVTCRATYLYGSEAKTAVKKLVVTVHKTDFRNSFLGDGIDLVLSDNPNIVKEYYFTETVSPTLYHNFHFSNGKLKEGETLEQKIIETPNSKASYSFIMDEVKKYEKYAAQKIIYSVEESDFSDPDFIPTPTQEAVITKFNAGELLTDDEKLVLGELVDNGIIYLMAIIPMKNWQENYYQTIISCKPMISLKPTYVLRTIVGQRMK